jgi:E3 ubiquitin-protein ligase UBR4
MFTQSGTNTTKHKLMQNASPLEQLLSDSLLPLRSYSLSSRVQFMAGSNRVEESRKICLPTGSRFQE